MFHAEIEATSRCNTRCLHCPHETVGRPGGRMSWECYTRIVGQIREHVRGGRFSLSFSGMGEPLLNPLIYDFIRHVAAEARTSFASNGAALTPGNVRRLAEAGLDTIYFSFNGDEPVVFSKMMGGLSYETILGNLRAARAEAQGTRLTIAANVSVARANQDRLTGIKRLLESEGIAPISFSLCHNRGGNLRDPEVCDTPPMGVERWACDVMANTLFVDWRGQAHICDHDLHDEHLLGDLMTEPLAVILQRRQQLLDQGCALQICRDCNDVMKVGGTPLLESGSGGIFRDWIYHLYEEVADPLSEANEALKWIFRIYQKENRTDRFANRLLRIEKEAHRENVELRRENAELRRDYGILAAERDALWRDQGILATERDALRAELARVQGTLDRRELELAALHHDYVAVKRSRAWRIERMLANDLRRLRRLLPGSSAGGGR